ncbi:SDR family NAD(P)-dependent oxidoreductase, partial [Rhizobium leguminosarum]
AKHHVGDLVDTAEDGMGAAIAERLSAEGARPIIHYGRERQRAEALLRKLGGNGLIVQADLSSPDGVFTLWRDALAAA